MARASSPAEFGLALRWLHLPTWAVILALVGFVRTYLQAGRPWLAWAVCIVRTLSLLLNFVSQINLNYREIVALKHVQVLGEPVAIAVGPANPFMLVGQLSLLLLVIFVADATFSVWRRGDRRRFAIGASILFFTLIGTFQAVLFLWGIVPAPIAVSWFFVGFIAVMGYELSADVLRAARLGEELRIVQERMNLAADAASLGLWDWDIVRDEIWGTDVTRPRLNLGSTERLSFNRFLEAIHPDDRNLVKETVDGSLKNGNEFEIEYRLFTSDGDLHWLATRGRLERDVKGEPVRIRGVAIDITDRKQTETELQRQRTELAHVARVSTMGQLSAALAHELTQPLAAILRNAEAAEHILERQPLDGEELRAIITDILKDDQRASAIIERVRSMLRRSDIQFLPLSVKQLLEQVLALLRTELISRKVAVKLEIPSPSPWVNGDRVYLQQVLVNLLVNGADAMRDLPEASRRLLVRVVRPADQIIEVAITDAGHGIPPERIDKLFEPFFTTKRDGMGIGLAISTTIVEAHGGDLRAENNPENGATFRFTLKEISAVD